MKKFNWILLFFVLAFYGLNVFAQDGNPPKKEGEKVIEKEKTDDVTAEDYKNIVAKLKKQDLNVDFVKLRRAYTKMANYSPYGGNTERGEMTKALDAENFEEAIRVVEKRLEDNYVDLYAHYVGTISHRKLGNQKKAKFHLNVFEKLIEAMLKTGDGKTRETAIYAVGINEQYIFMSYFGFRQKSKGLVQKEGHIYDVHTAFNQETSEEREFWFNIDDVFGKF